MKILIFMGGLGLWAVAAAGLGPQVLLHDNFDEDGNMMDEPPQRWKVGEAARSSPDVVRIVDSSVCPPRSGKHCVELKDNTGPDNPSNPKMQRDFTPTRAGSIEFYVLVPSKERALFAMELYSDKECLATVILNPNGTISYQGGETGAAPQGDPRDQTWLPSQWQWVRVKWFADKTFSAFIEEAIFANHVHFAKEGVPSKVVFRGGSAGLSNRQAYLDDVKVAQQD